jgi:hypothetical protein
MLLGCGIYVNATYAIQAKKSNGAARSAAPLLLEQLFLDWEESNRAISLL